MVPLAMLAAAGPPDANMAARLLATAATHAVADRAKPPWCIAVDGTDPSATHLRALQRRGRFLSVSQCGSVPASTRVDIGPTRWAASAWSVPIAVGTMNERGRSTCDYRFHLLAGKWTLHDVVICTESE